MANTYKVLGQVLPAATTPTTLYTVPGATSAVCSTLNICNQGSVAAIFRIAVQPAGATLVGKHYLAYDTSIQANDSIALTLGITLAATDLISVQSDTGQVSFNLFGSELS